MAVQNATPKDPLMFAGPAEATAKPVPIALTQDSWAWDLWKEGNALKLQDSAAGDVCVNQLLKTIHVGLLCVQESATDRPNMSVVSSMLSSDTMQLPAPEQPAFFTGRTWLKSTPDKSKSNEISANNVSITEMEPR
ncbi:hypothetical protein RJ639_030443 [Escallonia herrerae]|uniref:S-locus receptor kinase C-terminal domain-containing protein n=1 Tax=Escallonia herrerae TaxID=1293975 RepID=A0AA89BN78_9ASTE|nr:hypothetical protein RJ639_030443 [Escallonia herrerae]